VGASFVAHKIFLPRALPPVLGVGGFLKNTICLVQDDEAWVSDFNGSLESASAVGRFQETVAALLEAARIAPEAVAHDWHPDFYGTRWAQEQDLPFLGVQHHHAHIAAIMAEHEIDAPVLGLALDGFGLGINNESWGGELLFVDTAGFTRLGHLLPMPQPGGDRAAREPWRMGAAALWAIGRGDEIAERYESFLGAERLAMMMDRGLNAPLTSSAGRLFDAACGLLDVMPLSSFEGEAPRAFESMVTAPCVAEKGWKIEGGALDMRPLLSILADKKTSVVEGANLFHGTLAAACTDLVARQAQVLDISQVALGGGCFFNKVLRAEMDRLLKKAGLTPLWPVKMETGDGALALGQAYAAAMIIQAKGKVGEHVSGRAGAHYQIA